MTGSQPSGRRSRARGLTPTLSFSWKSRAAIVGKSRLVSQRRRRFRPLIDPPNPVELRGFQDDRCPGTQWTLYGPYIQGEAACGSS